jgi:ABC-type amino acid transport substrate-binding protein
MACAILATLLLLVATPLQAQTATTPEGALIIATKEAPPFAMKSPDGTWEGISITLWKNIAQRLGRPYTFVETDLKGMLDGVASGQYDVAAAAITVTSERQDRMDFSHPYFQTGLGIAVRPERGWLALLRGLPWPQIGASLLTLAALMGLAGLALWLIERRHNPEHFGREGVSGFGQGLWWSAVTMATVGYGDLTPRTLAGRIFAVVWMLASILLIASFTATMTSALTVQRLTSAITGPDDLQGRRVGAVSASTSAGWLDGKRMPYTQYQSVPQGLDALARGEIEAFVHDRPILLYYTSRRTDDDVTVIAALFNRQDYAFALPSGRALRKGVNKALLEEVGSPEWPTVLETWLGPEP